MVVLDSVQLFMLYKALSIKGSYFHNVETFSGNEIMQNYVYTKYIGSFWIAFYRLIMLQKIFKFWK